MLLIVLDVVNAAQEEQAKGAVNVRYRDNANVKDELSIDGFLALCEKLTAAHK